MDFSARFKIIGSMKRDLGTDLERIKPLAFRRGERSGPLLARFHHNRSRIDSHPSTGLLWQVYDWLCIPFSLWPIDFEGLARHILREIEGQGVIDSDILKLVKLAGAPPNDETTAAVASFEHVVESGNYDHLIKSPEKFSENDMAVVADEELLRTWEEIKQRWEKHIMRNGRGVIRRRLSQERNMRGDWWFDWKDEKKKFELFFDAMCYRWKLYGMEQDKPLLLKVSVNPTPHGTMIFIPRHWSLDPKRDLHWNKINAVHRAQGAERQGPKLSRNRMDKMRDAKRVEQFWTEAKAKGHTGDARYDFVHRKMGKPLTTDQSWVKRHLRIARKSHRNDN